MRSSSNTKEMNRSPRAFCGCTHKLWFTVTTTDSDNQTVGTVADWELRRNLKLGLNYTNRSTCLMQWIRDFENIKSHHLHLNRFKTRKAQRCNIKSVHPLRVCNRSLVNIITTSLWNQRIALLVKNEKLLRANINAIFTNADNNTNMQKEGTNSGIMFSNQDVCLHIHYNLL